MVWDGEERLWFCPGCGRADSGSPGPEEMSEAFGRG
jgi:hypothetical protein